MGKEMKLMCIILSFAILFAGCYSNKTLTKDGTLIEYVATKDGKKYEFEKAPVVANDSIVGMAKLKWYTQVNEEETSIPLSNVAFRGESNSGNIKYIVTKAGAKYTYEGPPAVVNRVVVGKAKLTGYTPVNEKQVSIPLSDVAEISTIPAPNLDDVELTFELHDGSYIVSVPGEQHTRIEGGYRVVGTITNDRNITDFEGFLWDEQISQITSRELNVAATVILLGLPALIVLGSIAFALAWDASP
jgi:hypothetical protein